MLLQRWQAGITAVLMLLQKLKEVFFLPSKSIQCYVLYVTYICQGFKKKQTNPKLNIPKNEQILIVEA